LASSPKECEFLFYDKVKPTEPEARGLVGSKVLKKVEHNCQEQKMFEDFSEIVLKVKGGDASALSGFWPMITTRTQTVMDALMKSMEKDGARIAINSDGTVGGKA